MKDLIRAINDTIAIIDQYCDLLILDDDNAERYISRLTNAFSVIMPRLVASYEGDDEDSAYMREYWIDQLKRILDALTSDDTFLKLDILKYETKENLKEFVSMVDIDE